VKKQHIKHSERYRFCLDPTHKNDARAIALEFIESENLILDIGCACGDFGVILKEEKNSLVYGIEFDASSAGVARNTGAYKSVDCIDLNFLDTKSYTSWKNKFDHIVLLDVLEHVSEPAVVFRKLSFFLREGGSIIASIPNIAHASMKVGLLNNDFTYQETGILDRTHLRFYTRDSIASFFAELGHEIKRQRPVLKGNLYPFHHETGRRLKIPLCLWWKISRDVQSYVYQYVMEVAPSGKREDEILKSNQAQLEISWSTVQKTARQAKRMYIEMIFFPVNSKRHKLVSKVASWFATIYR
jgi:2-polyprenyl-3-methyl-5-hydroxy-6-metoxy-1,4-benzoquinol methylase